ncbi:MAG: MFS transporter [Actinomycetota bacterium]|nr:MFS transporter [Actinomycetota bacterium]
MSAVPARGQSGFSRLALAHALSVGGDTIIAVALAGSIFFNVSADAARPKVLLYLAVTMVPFAILAPVMGPVLDHTRGGRRLVLAGCAAGRALLCLLMAGDINSILFYPEAFGALALSKGALVGKSSLVPAVVPEHTALVEANSRLALIAVLAGVVLGPVAAGLSAVTDARWVLRLGTLVLAAAAVAALRIPTARSLAPPAAPAEVAELRARPVLLAATAMAVLRAGVGFLTFFVAFALKRGHEPSWFFGLVLATGALGGLIGAVVAPPLRRRLREETILVAALLLPAVVGIFGARGFSQVGVLVVVGVVSVGASAGRLAFDSLVQRDAPDAARGRTFARFETRFQLAWVAGAFIPAALPIRDRLGFLILAVGLGFAGLSYLAGVRASRVSA